ncbi:MAG: zinc ABC transporter substrate-binding protein [Acidobacteriota bacterium]|nr:zinc ABC transporter substrate-binding protein [Acidobacteriota bacterium]
MKRSIRSYVLPVVPVALIAGIAGIVQFQAREKPAAGKLSVAGTIFPLYDIARNVAGDRAAVKPIVPPGASPHFFDFSPRQLEALRDVKAVFAAGYGLDDWVTRVATVGKGARVVIVDRGIALRRFSDGATDPHYWLHLGNARIIADNIADAMAELDPAQAAAYRRNAQAYKEKLASEERDLQDVLAPLRGSPILTFHDAWFYFAENFGLRIAGTFEPAAGEEPTPRYLAGLGRTIKTDGIRIVFIEPQFSTSALRSFARDHHVGIAELDPLGGIEGRATYLELMSFNANSVRQAFRKLQQDHE